MDEICVLSFLTDALSFRRYFLGSGCLSGSSTNRLVWSVLQAYVLRVILSLRTSRSPACVSSDSRSEKCHQSC
jgi:hypothetical protein